MRVVLAAVAALGLMAFAAPSAEGTGDTYVRPDWAHRPRGDDMARHYPPQAARLEIPGSALIVCMVRIDGQLRDCRVAEESPPGRGFGKAALAVSGEFRMRPAMRNGRPVEAEVRIPVAFNPPGPADVKRLPDRPVIKVPDFSGIKVDAEVLRLLAGLALGGGVLGALVLVLRPRRDGPTDI